MEQKLLWPNLRYSLSNYQGRLEERKRTKTSDRRQFPSSRFKYIAPRKRNRREVILYSDVSVNMYNDLCSSAVFFPHFSLLTKRIFRRRLECPRGVSYVLHCACPPLGPWVQIKFGALVCVCVSSVFCCPV